MLLKSLAILLLIIFLPPLIIMYIIWLGWVLIMAPFIAVVAPCFNYLGDYEPFDRWKL
jgi:hypothetical protein